MRPTRSSRDSAGSASTKKPWGKFGFVDPIGAIAIEPRFSNGFDFREGLAPAQIEPAGFLGFIDRTGAFVTEPQFRDVASFSEGLAAVEEKSAPGVRPKKGYIEASAISGRPGRHQAAAGSPLTREPAQPFCRAGKPRSPAICLTWALRFIR